jgi:octaprenyl-diphosphate synthase
MQRGTAKEASLIREAIEQGSVTQLEAVIRIVHNTGALEVSRLAAAKEAQRAVGAAQGLPNGPHTDGLLQLASQLLDRQT